MGNIKRKPKPAGYWKDFENVRRELQEIINKEYRDEKGNVIKKKREFPGDNHLRKIKKSDLASGARHHGGLNAVRKRMGYELAIKPVGYWQDFENVKRELKEITSIEYRDKKGKLIKAKKVFPSQKQLEKIGKNNLLHGISRHHKGINAVRKRLGYRLLKAEIGYWRNFKNVKQELENIISKEYCDEKGKLIKVKGKFPTQEQLRKIGKADLKSGIASHHKGINAVRKKLGYKLLKMEKGYWQDFENIRNELEKEIDKEYQDKNGKLIKAEGEFPTSTQLKEFGKYGLVDGMVIYHKGINAVMEKMGYKPITKPMGYWLNFENIKHKLEAVIEETGKFPSEAELESKGLHRLVFGIQRNHGGLEAVKVRLGYSEAVPVRKIQEFMEKVESIEGAKEVLGCSDLSLADKADILTNRSKKTFKSLGYTDWVLRSMFDFPPMRPYLRSDEPVFHEYPVYESSLERLLRKHSSLLDESNTYHLMLRKLENIYFRKIQKNRETAMQELVTAAKDTSILGRIYKQVHKNCEEMLGLQIRGAVDKVKNPYKVKERHLLEDGRIEWVHSGSAPDYVEFPSLHQKRGVLHIAKYKRLLIADEMGTGKTAQAILAKLYLEEKLNRKLKTLVICPNSVKELWIEKIEEYCEKLGKENTVIISGDYSKEKALKRAREGVDFVITNYSMVSMAPGEREFNIIKELKELKFDYVILDEVHNAKNLTSNRAKAVNEITRDVEYVVLLSGTPIPNRLYDLGMSMHILEPGLFPDPRDFNRSYSKNPRILRDLLLSGRMLRVRADEVIQLPSLKVNVVDVDVKDKQRTAYLRVFENRNLNSYTKLARLRRILIDPNIVPFGDLRGAESGKLEELDKIVKEKVTAGEKVVIYTNFKYRVTKNLARRYAMYGSYVIDGDVPARTRIKEDSEREKIRKEFQTSDKKVLIATVGTLCEGVDLTAARTVVFLDPPFTSTAREQSTARVYRLGQSRPVEVYSLIAKDARISKVTYDKESGEYGTIDEAIHKLVEKKERLIEYVMDGAKLTNEELGLLRKDVEADELLGGIKYAVSRS